MIGAQRPVAHHLQTGKAQPASLLQGEATQEPVIFHDEEEAKLRPTRGDKPPRTQERGGEGREIDELIPLRNPTVQVRENEHAGPFVSHGTARRAFMMGRRFISPQLSVQWSMGPSSFSPVT